MEDQKVVFFGCPLDSDERDESVQEKRAAMNHRPIADDPYKSVMAFVRNEVEQRMWE